MDSWSRISLINPVSRWSNLVSMDSYAEMKTKGWEVCVLEKLCSKIYIREICKFGFVGEIYVMKEKKSTNKILISISLAFGLLSLFSFVLYFYSANYEPYTYIDVIFLGPLFSFIGIVISIITRKSRKIHPVLWISGIISCMLSFIVCTFVFIVLIMLMAAK